MQAKALEILADMTRDLLVERGVEACLKTVTDTALRLVPADHASVRLCHEGDELRVGARSGVGADDPAPSFRKGKGIVGWVAQTGKLARLPDASLDPRFGEAPRGSFPVGSLMSVPIAADGNTVGVLTLSSESTGAFDDLDEAVSVLLANAAAQSLRAAQLEALAVTDSTTLAYNRRCLVPRLAEEMERSVRQADALSILLMDLDHFKDVNDRYGHAVGDYVLRAFADVVRDCVRATDVLVRRGGEEFVLVMPNSDETQARIAAERIRIHMQNSPLELGEGLSLSQTVSIGIAVWDGHESPATLDERADDAMYEAKALGRNRVAVAPRGTGPRRTLRPKRSTTPPGRGGLTA